MSYILKENNTLLLKITSQQTFLYTLLLRWIIEATCGVKLLTNDSLCALLNIRDEKIIGTVDLFTDTVATALPCRPLH